MKTKQKYIDIGFTRGLGYALAQLIRVGQENWAEYLFNESGLSFKDFEEVDVDEYDLKEIREMVNGDEDELEQIVKEKLKQIENEKD